MSPRRRIAATLTLTALLITLSATAASADVAPGDTVWIGGHEGYSGTGASEIFLTKPADPSAPGTPDFWAFCIEHDITPRHLTAAQVIDASDYLGANHFADPAIQGKVLWVLAHSYPATSLADLAAAAGISSISLDDALEATQYAIWRYTDLTFDASWYWSSTDSEAAYWYLVDGANASSGMTPADFAVTVSVTAPAAAQAAGSLVGPFVVHTDRPTAKVSASPAVPLRDAGGAAIDPDAVVDGQQIYLDLRGSTAAGAATLTASVAGSNGMGRVLSVPKVDGVAPTAADHAQTIILVAASGTRTSASASVSWSGTGAQLAATGADLLMPFATLAVLALASGALLTLRRRRTSA